MKLLLCVLFVAALLPGAVAAGPPNVLLVISDDEAVGSEEGHPRLTDWFTQGGTTFTNAFVTTPLCCPSRSSIMSGRYAHNHGVKKNTLTDRLDHSKTLQATLAPSYRTLYAGKFLNNWKLTKEPPHFDRWATGTGYEDARFNVDGALQRVDYGPSFTFDYAAGVLEGWESDDDEPWYAVVSPWAPHLPYEAEDLYAEESFPWDGDPAMHERNRRDKPAWVREFSVTAKQGLRIRERQLRTLLSVDDGFMRLIDHLETLGELDNTLVIYLSDNGYLWGQHGLERKLAPYLPSVKVPFYVRGPGVPVGTDDRIVANIDIAPTIYGATGVAPAYEVDGKPLFASDREHLFLEAFGGRGVPRWRSLVSTDWQFTRYHGGPRELYDLVADPYQLTNIARRSDTEPYAQLMQGLQRCAGPECP